MKHYINGIEVTPRNIQEIGFKSNFTENLSSGNDLHLSLNVESLILPNEGKVVIENWINQNGIFEGIPYDIKLDNGLVLNYYVDLLDGLKIRDKEVNVKVKKRLAFDNFYQLARDSSFELMNFKGVSFNFTDIPYIIQSPNHVELGVTVSISVFVMAKATIEAIQKLAELTAELVTALIPSVGVGVVVNVGAILLAALKVIIQIAYTIALIIALKKLLDQLKELIFPKVRKFKACKVKELLSKSCEFYGYTFKSTLLDSLDGLTILPIPLTKEKNKGFKSVFDYIQNDLNFAFTKGYPTGQDSVPTIWSLIEAIELTFNARCKVVNGVVTLERVDYWENNSNLSLIPSLTLQDTRQNEYSFNSFDVWKRYYIHYQPDYSDNFTLDNFNESDNEQSTEPINIINKDLVSIKGLNDRNIPFSQGNRKTKLNWLEKRVRDLFKLVDKIAGTSYAGQISNREGVLIISNQFYGNTKLLYTIGGKQPSNYMSKIGSTALWNNYHSINTIQNNGYKLKESVKILMNQDLFVNLLTNNWCIIDGKQCEILDIEYKENDSYATISYKEPFDYATGKVKTLVINE